MKKEIIIKSFITLVCVVLSISVLTGTIDEKGIEDTEKAFTRSLFAFGIARGINGVISVAQGTELSFQPVGIGLNFAPGEILDPINDLVERFSLVMLASSSAIGIQKILLEISRWRAFTLLFILSELLFLFLLWTNTDQAKKYRHTGLRIFMIMIVFRFSVPVFAMANEWVFNRFLSAQYDESSHTLEQATGTIEEMNKEAEKDAAEKNENLSFSDQIKQFYSNTLSYSEFKKRIETYKETAASTAKHMIDLMVVFLFQNVVFPLLFLLLLYASLKLIIRPTTLK